MPLINGITEGIPTHVVFYAEKTFEVIAKQRDWECEIVTKDVVLFYKP
jgi:hypothetical protein